MKIQDRLTKIDILKGNEVTDDHMKEIYPRSKFVASSKTSGTIDAQSVSLHARATSTAGRPFAGRRAVEHENCQTSLDSITDLEARSHKAYTVSLALGADSRPGSQLKVQEQTIQYEPMKSEPREVSKR